MLEVDKNDDGYNVVHDELGDDQLVIINTSASSFPLPKMFSFFGYVYSYSATLATICVQNYKKVIFGNIALIA